MGVKKQLKLLRFLLVSQGASERVCPPGGFLQFVFPSSSLLASPACFLRSPPGLSASPVAFSRRLRFRLALLNLFLQLGSYRFTLGNCCLTRPSLLGMCFYLEIYVLQATFFCSSTEHFPKTFGSAIKVGWNSQALRFLQK